jgi:hypothetical protein
MAASTDVDAFRALADGSDGSYCSDFSFLDDDAAALRAKLPKKTVKTDEQKRAAKQATDKARKDKLRQEPFKGWRRHRFHIRTSPWRRYAFDRPGATDSNKENGAVPPIGFMPMYVTPTTI